MNQKKTAKKIGANRFQEIFERQNLPGTVTCRCWDGEDAPEIAVKVRLSLQEAVDFVAEALSQCVDVEDGSYLPILKEFAIKRNILRYYASFKLPTDAHKQYRLIYGTDVCRRVLKLIDREQYGEIVAAIDSGIAFEQQKILSGERAQLAQFIRQMESMNAYFEQTFGDVNVQNLVKNLGEIQDMDEEKLKEVLKN